MGKSTEDSECQTSRHTLGVNSWGHRDTLASCCPATVFAPTQRAQAAPAQSSTKPGTPKTPLLWPVEALSV